MRSLRRVLFVLAFAVLATGASAQETRGRISGTVQDASGILPGATVRITSVDTSATQQLVTNARGYFEAPLLQPGNYRITVEMPGFKTLTQSGIVLAVGQQLTVTLTLEIGQISEEVTVTAEAPLLDTTAVSSAVTFDSKLLENLPMFSNMPIMLTRYASGVNPNANQSLVSQGFVDGTSAAAGSAIGGVGSNTYTIDGATNNGSSRRIASSPNSDMIQEMRVESSNFDASVGHGTGLQISMMTRAGTNRFRGTANYQYWTNKLNALNAQQKDTFSDVAKKLYEGGRSHNFAATVGGPVVIPGLVDGRGKLFFFANYSHVDDFIPGKNQGTSTIPANEQHLRGDFSDLLLLPNAAQYQIYDPLSVHPDPTKPNRYIRDPFPNNIIPANRIFNPNGSYKNPLFGLYAAMVPAPNQNFISPTQAPSANYYRGAEPDTPVSDLFGVRLDYNKSANDRFFFRGSGSTFLEGVGDWTYQTARVGLHSLDRSRYTWSYIGNWTHVAGNNLVIDSQFATNRFYQTDLNRELAKYKPSDMGLPTYLDAFCEARNSCMLPQVNIAGYQGISRGSANDDTATHIQGQVNLTMVHSAHTVAGGVDIRQAQRDRSGGGNVSGQFNFDRTYTRQASDETQLTPNNLGLSLASFMLGVPSSVELDDNSTASYTNHFFGAFAQDTWRAGRNLTINVGLRFEYETGVKERDGRMLVGFDETADVAIAQLAEAAYAKNPIPQLAASQFEVRGGGIYATAPGQSGQSWGNQAMWMPRVSAAYKVGQRTVLKSGYGIYYDTLTAADFGADQLGYNVTTVNTISTDFGQTFDFSLADPFPIRPDGSRYETPVGATLGADTVVGSAYAAANLHNERTRQQRWRVSVQRELARNLALEIGYNGSYADRVPVSIRQDYLPEEWWNGDNTRNTTQQGLLNGNVTNPFYIGNFTALETTDPVLYQRMAANSFFTSKTIQRNRLLRAFPHMSSGNGLVYDDLPLGEVKSHALEITLTHRYTNGLSANASFSATRTRESRTVEEYDRAPTLWQGSNGSRPYRITVGAVYELPFGGGRRLLNGGGPLGALVGGWQMAGTFEYQPGALLNWGNLFFYGNLDDIKVDNPTLDRWFNVDAGFETNPSKTPAAFQKRSFPFRVDGVRGYDVKLVNLNLSRSINLGGNRTFQVRMDIQNLFNRQHYRDPTLTPTSTNFGKITSVASSTMRFFTFGGRFSF